jgi:hypothetical protein
MMMTSKCLAFPCSIRNICMGVGLEVNYTSKANTSYHNGVVHKLLSDPSIARVSNHRGLPLAKKSRYDCEEE